MAKKKSYITVTDQFCGAGGTSLGVRRVAEKRGGGIEVKMALNHWQLAIDSHNANFPETQHDCTDISACNPRRYPSTDILLTSPECTNHSIAKGARRSNLDQADLFAAPLSAEAEERSRATMWDVPRFAEFHAYNHIVVENVPDARRWVGWNGWLQVMKDMGYDHRVLFFNAMFFHPVPQSRDRMYVVFWKKGLKKPDLEFCPRAYCAKCGKDVESFQRFKPGASPVAKYRTQYTYNCPVCAIEVTPYYYAAINAIDWSVPSVRIGDRKKPLEPRTMARIAFGLEKYGRKPLVITNYYSSGTACRVKDATEDVFFTQHSRNGSALVHPYMVDINYSHAGNKRVRSVEDPMRTQTTAQEVGMVLPYLVETKYDGDKRASGPDEVMRTQTGQQSMGVVMPMMVSTNYFDDRVIPAEGTGATQTTAAKYGVAYLATLRGTSNGSLENGACGLDEPIGTISAGGKHHALITGQAAAYLVSHYRTNKGSSITDAMPAVTCTDRHGLVELPTAELPAVEDLCFRMVTDVEVGRAQAFPDDYIVHGNKRERVKQFGNANPHPVPEWIVNRLMDSLN